MKPLIALFSILINCLLMGQNLVPNPSFEEHTGCPQGYPDLNGKCNDWGSFRGSPDYFHNCSSMNGYNNNWGYQEPHLGEGYIGIITYSVTGANPSLAREHAGIQLISPLIIGEKYYVSFFLSAAWNPANMNIASNKTGVLFTTDPYFDENSAWELNNSGHIITEEIVLDTIDWIKISGYFIADSAYEYLVIGNFFENNYTDTVNFPNSFINQTAYQYIDDVCVSTDSLYNENWTILSIEEKIKDNVLISPNPATDHIIIKFDDYLPKELIISDINGRIYIYKEVNINEQTIDISYLKDGIYFIHFPDILDGIVSKKLIVKK